MMTLTQDIGKAWVDGILAHAVSNDIRLNRRWIVAGAALWVLKNSIP
jgi:hypothetical protein